MSKGDITSETEEQTQVTTGETPADVAPEGATPKEENKPNVTVEADASKFEKELAEANRRISELNAESAERRVKLKEFEEAEAERARESMSELEKAQADAKSWEDKHNALVAESESRYQQLETEFKQYRISHVVERAANELGFAHPQDALALINLTELTIDDDGKVEGFEEKLKALADSGRLPMRDNKPQIGTPSRKNGRQSGGSDKDARREQIHKEASKRFSF